MVKPPCDLGRTGVLEVDDGIFVAVELGFVKERAGAMQQAGVNEFGVFANALAIKTGEECGGASSVEALVVEEDSDFQWTPQNERPNRPEIPPPKKHSGAFPGAR